ncbi:hypothetical protein CLTEP_26400 [Clostridium tepidiprofundi DSM 19306]|uniref:Uncharacterized protein n=1 Tax=Clostridium tepidiprofundi DSM 19306 TaxID=1121338 RepID=A0A151AS86_9CLOT|nr:hypothetical protein [Clostridium tepidiprofundi]KYH30475.1 hypothetical protein CLTEP_26400 [Clostridium tepidiprofundi DSM 19306]
MGKLSIIDAQSHATTWYNLIYGTSLGCVSQFLNYLTMETIHNKVLIYSTLSDFEDIEDYLKKHSQYNLVKVEVQSEKKFRNTIPYQAKIIGLRTTSGEWILTD